MGFIETPYRKVTEGKVDMKKITFLSAEEEDTAKIAQANIDIDEKGNFVDDRIKSRQTGDFPILDKEEVEYMDVAPNQIVGLSASLIPFLEHDDANRALMGSNMQRQAVPLIKPESPIVGTGLEGKAARDARIQVHADGDGVVEYVDANEIHVRYKRNEIQQLVSFEEDLVIYKLTKFVRTNQETTINLRPAVIKGQKVAEGDFLTEGYATKAGELALGRNMKVAFMPWKGYNFEDAIVISEKVVKEDLFTSIHIGEYEVEVRDTKLGEEELTADIPNVSEEATKDLDQNGIIRIGAHIKEGDIIIGKITPKGESDPTPEEKLLRAIFGDKAGDAKEKFLQPAVTQASQRLKAEGTIYIRRKLSEAAQRGENINDPAVQLRISQDAQNYFYQRPEYSDVDSYYDITNLQSIGKAKGAPVLGFSKKDATGRWQISIQDADNRASFAAIARPYFINNPAAARTYLSNEFVLNEKELGEINRALATGNMSSVGASTRRSLSNLVNTAFGNKISTAELVQKQLGKFFDGNVPPNYRENAFKLQVATRTPVAGTGVKPQDTLLYVSKWTHTHSKAGNQAVDFFIERGNQAQSANPLPSPISGIVRFAGKSGGFGNTVVIEALENGPGYRRGDRLLFGHAARLNVQVGQRVNRGQFLLVAGDQSPTNSVPGRSTTGTGDKGHLHSQLFRPGQGFPSTSDQYGQETQNTFVRKNLFPLFRSISDPNKR